MTPLELMRQKYVAESGLGRLDPYPDTNLDHGFTISGVETCNNENGILFLAFMLVQALRAGYDTKANLGDDIAKAAATVKTLQRLPIPGLYCRQPGNFTRTEAHDNYVGICAISAMNEDTETPWAMVRWAYSHWFCFNNVEPEKFNKILIRQGGEIAFYFAAAKRRAPLWLWLWLCGGMITSGYKDAGASTTQLAWLRFWTIDRVGGPKGILNTLLYQMVKWYWFSEFKKRYGTIGKVFDNYFKPEHPVHSFEAEVPLK